MDSFLTPSEIAKRLRLSEKTVYKLIATRDLPAVRFGGQYRISLAALERRLARPAGVKP